MTVCDAIRRAFDYVPIPSHGSLAMHLAREVHSSVTGAFRDSPWGVPRIDVVDVVLRAPPPPDPRSEMEALLHMPNHPLRGLRVRVAFENMPEFVYLVVVGFGMARTVPESQAAIEECAVADVLDS